MALYAAWGRKVANAVDLDREERNFKIERVKRVKAVFAAARVGGDPAEAFRTAFSGFNIVDFRVVDSFLGWMRDAPADARTALRELSAEPGAESIDRFVALVPREAASGVGAALSLAPALLMGLDPENLPPWRSEPADMTRRLTGGYQVEESATAEERYLYFLERLDPARSAMNADSLVLSERLDAQGLAWTIAKYPAKDFTTWSDAEVGISTPGVRGNPPRT